MTLWESEKGLTAAQRRVLIARLVSEANKEALANEKMRIGCFERTGMLRQDQAPRTQQGVFARESPCWL